MGPLVWETPISAKLRVLQFKALGRQITVERSRVP